MPAGPACWWSPRSAARRRHRRRLLAPPPLGARAHVARRQRSRKRSGWTLKTRRARRRRLRRPLGPARRRSGAGPQALRPPGPQQTRLCKLQRSSGTGCALVTGSERRVINNPGFRVCGGMRKLWCEARTALKVTHAKSVRCGRCARSQHGICTKCAENAWWAWHSVHIRFLGAEATRARYGTLGQRMCSIGEVGQPGHVPSAAPQKTGTC
eukprot:365964-Chlamydomonas_euryale.AAC.8